ncbi:MAG: glycerol-3-phosphate 1-O-acyltransferase PlsY [Clostridia bacterium]|nr:glycerol-3-phosphate 1-O-acyltransferase PlsY [Clostridia bacterium]
MALKIILCLILGYLFGSLNFAIIYSKLRSDDIRNHGSGNAGATNVLRTYGKGAAALVFILDILKGVIAVAITRIFLDDMIFDCMAALGAVLGHNFPIYYGFKGGKGVATSLAVLLALHFPTALAALITFIIVVTLTKYVSLSSILAAIAAIITSFIFFKIDVFSVFCLIIGSLCIYRHRSNIVRLLKGTENKLGEKKKG